MKSKIKKSIKIAFLFALLFIEISCEKKKPIELDKRPIDANAHIYDTIQIGEQVWMKQNFRGSKFIDSSDIPNNLNHEEWQRNILGASSNYNGDVNNDIIYGKLYNWYAVKKGILAPKGWHIADVKDWDELNNFLGLTNAGDNMKATCVWEKDSRCDNTNSSGFSALPSGVRNHVVTYDGDRQGAYFWTPTISYTKNGEIHPWNYQIGYNHPNMGKENNYHPPYGLAIRCVKD